MLKDKIPATEHDMKKMSEGMTWKVYQQLKSGDLWKTWEGLMALVAGLEGQTVGGKWIPTNENKRIRLYRPDFSRFNPGDGGHLDLGAGEVALTFDENMPLNYLQEDKKECMVLDGALAMVVTIDPEFGCRRCSTYHWTNEIYELPGQEYLHMRAQINRLIERGDVQLARQLGQVAGSTPDHRRGTTRAHTLCTQEKPRRVKNSLWWLTWQEGQACLPYSPPLNLESEPQSWP